MGFVALLVEETIRGDYAKVAVGDVPSEPVRTLFRVTGLGCPMAVCKGCGILLPCIVDTIAVVTQSSS